MDYHRDIGYFKTTPPAYADLGEIASGQKNGRENDYERTMSINLGIAPDDMVTAKLIFEKAIEKGIGTSLSL